MIKEKLKIIEKKLAASLEEIRISYQHRGDIGSVAESVFRDFLRTYLPPENRVGEGEIIDSSEQISTQLDIIITNQYHPYLNDLKKPGLFIIEGVACAGEVKTNLNSNDLDTLIESCIKYKNLKLQKQPGTLIYGNKSDMIRFYDHRPYFIFAYNSQLTIETVHKKLKNYYEQNGTPIEHQIDGVFCLDRGSIINFGDGEGTLKFSTMEKKSMPGLIITRVGAQEVLFDLMSWLSTSMLKYTLSGSPLTLYLLGKQPLNPDAP